MEDKQMNPVTPEYEERDASFDPDPVSNPQMSDDELQDALLEDSGMNRFQKFMARLDDKTFTIYQRILGVVLAALSCVCLFWDGGNNQESAFSYNLVLAVVFALLIPNIIEKQGLRRIPKARTTMAIAIVVLLALYFLVTGILTGFTFRSA